MGIDFIDLLVQKRAHGWAKWDPWEWKRRTSGTNILLKWPSKWMKHGQNKPWEWAWRVGTFTLCFSPSPYQKYCWNRSVRRRINSSKSTNCANAKVVASPNEGLVSPTSSHVETPSMPWLWSLWAPSSYACCMYLTTGTVLHQTCNSRNLQFVHALWHINMS